MAIKQVKPSELRRGEKVTVKIATKESRFDSRESVIYGTVSEQPTSGGNVRVTFLNNKNSIVLKESTNAKVFVDRGPTVGEVLSAAAIGAKFAFKNRYGVTKKWVKTGNDRVTLIDDARPAYSLSISAGFPSSEDDNGRVRFF